MEISMEPLKLSELTSLVQKVLGGTFGRQNYWVIADISNHSYQPQKGFHFFDLVEKDEVGFSLKAKVNATAWGTGSQKIQDFERITGQKFKNDIRILALVSLEYHSVYGLKLQLQDLDVHFTLGALELQRQNTLRRLVSECSEFIRKVGERYITRNQEIPFNKVLQTLAVISSRNSAGFADFEHTLQNNAFGYHFWIHPFFTAVQGENNAEAIWNILIDIFKSKKKYDAVLILRGGGASTDFLIFDTFNLSKVVAKFPIPIITGIGHLKNETLVDLMAHTSTKTPTQAAEFIISHNREFETQLIRFEQSITIRSQKFLGQQVQNLNRTQMLFIDKCRGSLNRMEKILVEIRNKFIRDSNIQIYYQKQELVSLFFILYTLPKSILGTGLKELLNHGLQIKLGVKNSFLVQNGVLVHYTTLLRVLSPENILKRGYAIIKREGEIVSNSSGLEPGNNLDIILYEEELRVILREKRKRNGKEFDL